MSHLINAIVPAAGIGTRMGAAVPKQYLPLAGQPILGHTLDRLLAHPQINSLVVALHPQDKWFASLPQAKHSKITCVMGGTERADSVLNALKTIEQNSWALVHDAARPCVTEQDIDKLILSLKASPQGSILALPVRDTMKQARLDSNTAIPCIEQTICREQLWHALTPQLFPTGLLAKNIAAAMAAGIKVTDESSAMEWAGYHPALIAGRADNIKVTHPDDLDLAELFLQAQVNRF